MTGTVSSLSIAFMAISCLIDFGVPIALFIYLLTWSHMINSGNIGAITGSLSGDALAQAGAEG